MFGLEKLLIGQTLGGWYRVDDVLGGGGFGVVFRATELRPERAARKVAVKVLAFPAGLDDDGRARMRERFRQEAAFAAALPHHPNVVPISDYGSDRGLDYLVMELLRGEDLRRRLARPEPVPLALALRILRDAARGVGVGHGAGLIHRDVKPGNVFLSEGGDGPVVRVLDFGIAKRVETEGDGTAAQLTRHGEGLFSGRYASPEQLRRETRLTRASDVFSLGVVGWEVLTRSRLFEGADQERRESGLEVPIPSLVARNPEVPAAVEAVLVRALAHDPQERFRDAAAFEEALRAACREAGLRLDVPHRQTTSPVDGEASKARVAGEEDATTFIDADPPEPVSATAERVETAMVDEAETAVASPGDHAVFADETRVAADASSWESSGPMEDDSAVSREDRRTPTQRRRRWRRPHQISRRSATAVAVAVFLLLGGAIAMSAAAAGSGAALLDRLFGAGAGEEARAGEVAALERLSAAEANRHGLADFRAGRFADASEAFRRAHRLAPAVAEYHNNYAWSLFKSRQFRRSALELERVVSRHPDRWLARENLAAAYLAAGDTAAAVRSLERLVERRAPARYRVAAERLLTRLGGDADGFVAPETVIHASTHTVTTDTVVIAVTTDVAPPAGGIAVDTATAAPRR